MLNRILHPVRVGDEEFYLAGALEGAGLSFWLEKPAGKKYQYVNEPAIQVDGVDPHNEIVVLSWEDPEVGNFLTNTAMASGWFERTGKTVNHPRNQVNEVWRLSSHGVNVFRPPAISATIMNMVSAAVVHKPAPKHNNSLDGLIAELISEIRDSGFIAMAMFSPNPTMEDGSIGRLLVAASTKALATSRVLVEGSVMPGGRALIDSIDLQRGSSAQARELANLGYRNALVVRIPILGAHCHEFVFLSISGMISDASMSRVSWGLLNRWPYWRQAISDNVCPLSPRERECLTDAASGLTGLQSATNRNCTERTIRLHLDNARKKLKASTTAEAIHRAALMCVF